MKVTEPYGKAKRHAYSFVAEIDEAELACRLMETAIGLKRPPSETRPPAVIMAEAREHLGNDSCFRFGLMARRAIEYFGECVEKGKQPS